MLSTKQANIQLLRKEGGKKKSVLDCILTEKHRIKSTSVERWSNKYHSSGCIRYYSANRINCNRFTEFNGDKKKATKRSFHTEHGYTYSYCRHTSAANEKKTNNGDKNRFGITFGGHCKFSAGLRRSAMHLSHFEFDICDWQGHARLIAVLAAVAGAHGVWMSLVQKNRFPTIVFNPLIKTANGWNLPMCNFL